MKNLFADAVTAVHNFLSPSPEPVDSGPPTRAERRQEELEQWNAADLTAEQLFVNEDGLRTDGPDLESWLVHGNKPESYPPARYAPVLSPAYCKLKGIKMPTPEELQKKQREERDASIRAARTKAVDPLAEACPNLDFHLTGPFFAKAFRGMPVVMEKIQQSRPEIELFAKRFTELNALDMTLTPDAYAKMEHKNLALPADKQERLPSEQEFLRSVDSQRTAIREEVKAMGATINQKHLFPFAELVQSEARKLALQLLADEKTAAAEMHLPFRPTLKLSALAWMGTEFSQHVKTIHGLWGMSDPRQTFFRVFHPQGPFGKA